MGICIIRHTEKKRIIPPVGEPAGNDNSDSETENFHCIVFFYTAQNRLGLYA